MSVRLPRRPTRVLASVVLACTLVSCGSETGTAPEASTEVVPKDAHCFTGVPQRPEQVPASCGEVRAVGEAVVDSGVGPELCLGVVQASDPPRCSGPTLDGWSWDEVEHQARAGVRHAGGVLVTGTFDGTTFTLTGVSTREDADPAVWGDGLGGEDDPLPDFTTPCAPPKGGWRAVDAARATYAHQEAGILAAERLPGHVEAWVDEPAGEKVARLGETRTVLNLATSGDVAEVERVVRGHWGGALCVSTSDVRVTRARLDAIQDEVMDLPGALTGSSDNRGGTVDLLVVNDDGRIQAWCDAEYGRGRVRVTSAMEPIRRG